MDDNIYPGFYAVAYIDILGQQDCLRNIKGLPNPDSSKEIEEFTQSLKDTYGTVQSMRESFRNSFDMIANFDGRIDQNQFSAEESEIFKAAINPSISSFAFSDFITIYMSLRKEESAINIPISGIHGMLGAAGIVSLAFLAVGHPIRGGIDVGIAFEIDNGEVYGPALARAYSLESNISQYPRITIGEEMVNYLRVCANQNPNGDKVKEIEKIMANQCIKYIAVDDDGIPFIDYLGKEFQEKHMPDSDDLKRDAYNFIVRKSNQYKEEKNSKLAFRYALLRNYFDDRLSLGNKCTSNQT